MIVQTMFERLPLKVGDEVVAAVQFHDYILVFTRHGAVYRLERDGLDL